ncbi:MAG TPA: hypothetical protein VFB66_03350 [Tepidisphaeraceae bacterium]|nr:hypothetical protein [Tepidisphaeraceae bacterium]
MKRQPLLPPLCVGVIIVCIAGDALAWSTKEHILLTRITVSRLLAREDTPAEMKAWLREAAPGLPDLAGEKDFLLHARLGPFPRGVDGIAYWAVVPDLQALADSGAGDRAKKVEPFGVPERALHFIDLELFMEDESRRRFKPDLSNKPRIEDIPCDMADPRFERAGMLPFRVEQCYGELVESLRDGRLNDRPGQFPRDDHAAKWAGYLAHYVQDNTQPHHATVDYRSASYFTDPRTAPNVHADMEFRLVDDEYNDFADLRVAFWEAFVKALEDVQDPVTTEDLFRATLEVAMQSYDALPLIGQAAVVAYGAHAGGEPRRFRDFDAPAFYGFRGVYQGRELTLLELKARQMAWAVKRLEGLLLRAWRESHGDAKAPPQGSIK